MSLPGSNPCQKPRFSSALVKADTNQSKQNKAKQNSRYIFAIQLTLGHWAGWWHTRCRSRITVLKDPDSGLCLRGKFLSAEAGEQMSLILSPYLPYSLSFSLYPRKGIKWKNIKREIEVLRHRRPFRITSLFPKSFKIGLSAARTWHSRFLSSRRWKS